MVTFTSFEFYSLILNAFNLLLTGILIYVTYKSSKK